ncbi:aldo/keto reductase [Cuniculiplasma sp. SKW4]|uniref:aldo/keto reductase n=1 Tax=Cuniculiplasma sp. SKW4 TaxID=3400171 RepID=UPI003FD39F05
MIERDDFSPFGLGTWRMGGGSSPDHSKDREWVNIIDVAMKNGINVIDTAEMYGGGHAEELVGKALELNDRDKVFIITKAWPSSYGKLKNAINNSMKRMKIDYVDLYLLHWPDENYPIETLIKELMEIKDEGLARYVGVSNFQLDLLMEANELSGHNLYANQIELNVSKQSTFNEVREYCEENNILPIAYSPLNRNRMPDDIKLQERIKKSGLSVSSYSLLYTISLGAYPIPKFSTTEHLEALLEAYEQYSKGKIRMF